MPIYAYRCAACGHARDVLRKLSDPALTLCPACGADQFEKQVTAAGFQLKGSGWYATDFRNNGAAKPAAEGKDASDKGGAAPAADAGSSSDAGSAAKTGSGASSESSSSSAATPPASSPPAASSGGSGAGSSSH